VQLTLCKVFAVNDHSLLAYSVKLNKLFEAKVVEYVHTELTCKLQVHIKYFIIYY
jgi:hypothetical protein